MVHPGRRMPPGLGEKVVNHLVVLMTMMIIETKIKLVWIYQLGDKRLGYQEGQRQLLPIIDFQGIGIDSVKIFLRVLAT